MCCCRYRKQVHISNYEERLPEPCRSGKSKPRNVETESKSMACALCKRQLNLLNCAGQMLCFSCVREKKGSELHHSHPVVQAIEQACRLENHIIGRELLRAKYVKATMERLYPESESEDGNNNDDDNDDDEKI